MITNIKTFSIILVILIYDTLVVLTILIYDLTVKNLIKGAKFLWQTFIQR